MPRSPSPAGRSPPLIRTCPIPPRVARAYTDAANAGDIDAALAFWADDATYTILPAAFTGQSLYTGKAQLRALFEAFATQRNHTDLIDPQVEGDTVTARVTTNSFPRLGLDAADATVRAVVRQGQIQSATFTFTPETMARIEQALARGTPTQLPRTGDANSPWVASPWTALLLVCVGVGLLLGPRLRAVRRR